MGRDLHLLLPDWQVLLLHHLQEVQARRAEAEPRVRRELPTAAHQASAGDQRQEWPCGVQVENVGDKVVNIVILVTGRDKTFTTLKFKRE